MMASRTLSRARRLRELLLLAGLDLEVLTEFVDGVELAGQLREVVVGLGELALLDGLERHGHTAGLAFVLAAGEGRGEGRRLIGRESFERFVHALEHGACADLVGDVGG